MQIVSGHCVPNTTQSCPVKLPVEVGLNFTLSVAIPPGDNTVPIFDVTSVNGGEPDLKKTFVIVPAEPPVFVIVTGSVRLVLTLTFEKSSGSGTTVAFVSIPIARTTSLNVWLQGATTMLNEAAN